MLLAIDTHNHINTCKDLQAFCLSLWKKQKSLKALYDKLSNKRSTETKQGPDSFKSLPDSCRK